jgi:hypothetical protein
MNYEEFIHKMREINKMSFVQTHRKGPTGIGARERDTEPLPKTEDERRVKFLMPITRELQKVAKVFSEE